MEILAENATTQCFIFNTANDDDDNGEREAHSSRTVTGLKQGEGRICFQDIIHI